MVRLFAKAADLGTFALFRENADLLRALNKRLKLFRGEDGWFATGRNGQVWEWGRGKLGFTAGAGVMISKAIEGPDLSQPSGETWKPISHAIGQNQNAEKLARLLKLRARRPSVRVRTRSTEHLFKKKSACGGGSGTKAQTGPAERETTV